MDAGIKVSVAAEMLGMYLPNGMEYADLDPDEPEPAAPVVVMAQPGPEDDEAASIEAGQFKRWLRKRPGRDISGFKAVHLTAETMRQLAAEVNQGKSEAQGSETPAPFPVAGWGDYP